MVGCAALECIAVPDVDPVLEYHRFEAKNAGKCLIFIGGVHGDEAGPRAAARDLVNRLADGSLRQEAGEIVVIPDANPRAGALNQRWIAEDGGDFNRNFRRYNPAITYVQKLQNQICDLVEAAIAKHGFENVVLVDLHDFPGKGLPFIVSTSDSPSEAALIKAIGPDHVLAKFIEAHERSNISADEAMTIVHYFARNYGITAIALEAGGRDDDLRLGTYDQCLRVAAHVGVIADTGIIKPPSTLLSPTTYEFQRVVRQTVEGVWIADGIVHRMPVKKGQVLAYHEDGTPYMMAARDCVVISPNLMKGKIPLGRNLIYFADEVAKP